MPKYKYKGVSPIDLRHPLMNGVSCFVKDQVVEVTDNYDIIALAGSNLFELVVEDAPIVEEVKPVVEEVSDKSEGKTSTKKNGG